MNWLEDLPLPVAGVDEAGRGPLAGPVTAAAVVLAPDQDLSGIGDSKALSEKRREILFERIQKESLAWAVGWASAEEIDRINILQATFLAMRRALGSIEGHFASVAVDGNRPIKELSSPQRTIVKGDAKVKAIGAASILAKVSRDHYMLELHAKYPEYDFARHKGYPTPEHMQALRLHGPCPEHRRSFSPVAQLLLL